MLVVEDKDARRREGHASHSWQATNRCAVDAVYVVHNVIDSSPYTKAEAHLPDRAWSSLTNSSDKSHGKMGATSISSHFWGASRPIQTKGFLCPKAILAGFCSI